MNPTKGHDGDPRSTLSERLWTKELKVDRIHDKPKMVETMENTNTKIN